MALDTEAFIKALNKDGYTHFCVVPCSFAKDLINGIINQLQIKYTPCASEAIACSLAAGIKMSGGKPVVLVQSSGITNMGSCITSLLSPYGVRFPIIVSWRTYKEGDSEIQHKHLAKKLPDLILAYGYECTALDKKDISCALKQIESCNDQKRICLLENKTFSPVYLQDKYQKNLPFPPRSKYLSYLNDFYKSQDVLFIGTTGNTAREMYKYMPETYNFYMAGNMGGALSLGLGAALQKRRKVIVCGGDAEFTMHMGGITTAGRYNNLDIDLTYIVFDNESNKSTGGQNSYQNHINYIEIAKNMNLRVFNQTIRTVEKFSESILFLQSHKGVKFIHIKCSYDNSTPRPPLKKIKTKNFPC